MRNTLKHDVFENVLIGPSLTTRPIFGGGLVSPQKYPKFCRHNRHGKPNNSPLTLGKGPIPKLKTIDGVPYVFGGVYLTHFGHFIAEFLHRLWVLERPEHKNCTVLFVAKESSVPPKRFFIEAMEYLGVKKWQILTDSHCVEKLVIAEQGKTLGRKSHPEYAQFLRRLADRNNIFLAKNTSNISIMRGHLASRRLLAEKHLQNYLTQQGFTQFRPEEHPLIDQLKTIANAGKIILSDGSTGHLLDLLPEIQAEVAFLARPYKTNIPKNSVAPKVRHVSIFDDVVSLITPLNSRNTPQETRALLYAPLSRIINFLKYHNFIKKNAPDIRAPDYVTDMQHYLSSRSEWHQDFDHKDNQTILQQAEIAYAARHKRGFISALLSRFTKH